MSVEDVDRTVALAARLQLSEALAVTAEPDVRWVLRAVAAHIAWRWWSAFGYHAPAEQRLGLAPWATTGFAQADQVKYGLGDPTPDIVNTMVRIGVGVGLCMMWDAEVPGRGDLRLLGLAGLPRLPQVGEVSPVRVVPWCDRLPARSMPAVATSPAAAARDVAGWMWEAASARRPVCLHGVVRHPDWCGRPGGWIRCGDCCTPGGSTPPDGLESFPPSRKGIAR